MSGAAERTVAFVTYRESPDLIDDDRLAAEALRRRGLPVTAAVWSDPGIAWSAFAAVVIRSAWDYHHQPDAYAAWLRRCDAGGVRLWNPPRAVLANLHKRYLCDLAARGIEVVETEFVEAGSDRVLGDVLARRGWDRAVVKPAVSASAHGTWRTSRGDAAADQARFAAQARAQELLVQPFVPEVASPGEWSLIFFAGRYSHAVIKQPAAGDFRVQEELGGRAVPAEPPPRLVDGAGAVLDACGERLLYARVDGIERDGGFVLMELEINEPFLFIGTAAGAAERFADAVAAAL